MTPTLTSERLVLRALFTVRKHHLEWLNDKQTMAYSEQRHVVHTLASAFKYLRNFNEASSHIWAIHEVETQKHIGNISVLGDDQNKTAEMGILIGERSVWGKGYGLEAWKTVLNWLLQECEIRKVEAGCMANNLGMRRICEKAEMKMEGERKGHFLFQGNPVGLIQYGKFK